MLVTVFAFYSSKLKGKNNFCLLRCIFFLFSFVKLFANMLQWIFSTFRQNVKTQIFVSTQAIETLPRAKITKKYSV
jgi:hypothetical protein